MAGQAVERLTGFALALALLGIDTVVFPAGEQLARLVAENGVAFGNVRAVLADVNPAGVVGHYLLDDDVNVSAAGRPLVTYVSITVLDGGDHEACRVKAVKRVVDFSGVFLHWIWCCIF